MASCVKNIRTKNIQIRLLVSSYSQKCRGCFFGTQCSQRIFVFAVRLYDTI